MLKNAMESLLSNRDLSECLQDVDLARLEGSRILITGASGCIGGGIAEALIAAQKDGLSIDLILSGRSLERLQARFGSSDVEFCVTDLANGVPVPAEYDHAVHAASLASPKQYLSSPLDTLRVNSIGLMAIASGLRLGSRLLYISSGEIYGSPPPESVPTPEDYLGVADTKSSRSCYVEAKRFGESFCMALWRELGIEAVISRPIHVYGPGLLPDDGRAICDFVSKAIRGEQIVILSDGLAKRSFCYLSDATRLHLQLLASAPAGSVYNVGRSEPETSIRELASTVARVVGDVPVTFGEAKYTAGSPSRSCPCIELARASFGYSPSVSLEQGLLRLAADFRKREGMDDE